MSETIATLVLASASPARLATLRAAGVDPRVLVSGVDEPGTLAQYPGIAADEVPLVLARAKAEQVAHRPDVDEELILGCDSVLELDGEPLGKPPDAEQARERWTRMSGRSAVLHTGHWLVDARDLDADGSGATLGMVCSTIVHFADVGCEEVAAYVATGEPLQVAGGFTIDGLGGAFVRGIEGDHHNVVGLSLPTLRDLLGRIGVTWTDLWRPRSPLDAGRCPRRT